MMNISHCLTAQASVSPYLETSSAVFSSPLSAAAGKSLQSCLTLCDPKDGSPPGSPIPRILQARVLEWGAIAFSITTLYLTTFLITSLSSKLSSHSQGTMPRADWLNVEKVLRAGKSVLPQSWHQD